MQIETHEPIYRDVDPVLIDMGGTASPIRVRYRVLAVAGAATVLGWLAVRILIPNVFNGPVSILAGLVVGVAAGAFFAERLTPELTFTGWWGTFTGDITAWRLHHAQSRTHRPVRVHPARIRRGTRP